MCISANLCAFPTCVYFAKLCVFSRTCVYFAKLVCIFSFCELVCISANLCVFRELVCILANLCVFRKLVCISANLCISGTCVYFANLCVFRLKLVCILLTMKIVIDKQKWLRTIHFMFKAIFTPS